MTIALWKGIPLEEYSKEDLIEILKYQAKFYKLQSFRFLDDLNNIFPELVQEIKK